MNEIARDRAVYSAVTGRVSTLSYSIRDHIVGYDHVASTQVGRLIRAAGPFLQGSTRMPLGELFRTISTRVPHYLMPPCQARHCYSTAHTARPKRSGHLSAGLSQIRRTASLADLPLAVGQLHGPTSSQSETTDHIVHCPKKKYFSTQSTLSI